MYEDDFTFFHFLPYTETVLYEDDFLPVMSSSPDNLTLFCKNKFNGPYFINLS